MTDELLYEAAGGVARVTINRPERRNAMSYDVMSGLRDAMASAAADDDVRVVVLTGAGDKRVLRRRRSHGHRRQLRCRGGAHRARPARRPVPGHVVARQADRGAGARVRARRRFRSRVRVRPRRRRRRCGVRHARDQRRAVAVHDHGAVAAFDAAQDRARPDDDRPPCVGGRGRRGSGSCNASCRSPSST